MGLIGAVMSPLYWGAGAVLMPPAAFLQKPLRWLKLLSEYGQHSPVGCPAPNFSYQLCVDQISEEDAKQLDLSNFIFALNGAEPIRASTIDSFCDKFGGSGFNRDVIVPSYGMAECTLLSTCRQQDPIIYKTVDAFALSNNRFEETADPSVSSLSFVSAGSNCEPQTLRIVDPEDFTTKADNQVGEIWLKGPHIAHGYWGQTQLSKDSFEAYTADGEGPFMRTGDLACLSDGQLFVTGRLKDLLIIRGQNHYPQDIELTANQAFEGLHLDNAAAFTIDHNNEEKLVIVQEVMRSHHKNFDTDAAAQAIRNAVARKHGIDVHAIAFMRFASLPKTTS
jgi:acyl-CoA synthetase (AMP-forming)/AMP-acid ligase II